MPRWMSLLVGLIPYLIYVLTFIRMWCILVEFKRPVSRKDAMEDHLQDVDGAQIGDKVRFRFGIHAKERGIVQATVGSLLEIQLEKGGLIQAGPEEITNYSLAARRAWRVMPKRAGRHQLETPRKKMASLRLNVDVLDDLDKAAELGLIPNKEQAVNTWVRQKLDLLLGKEARSDARRE